MFDEIVIGLGWLIIISAALGWLVSFIFYP